LHGLPFYAFAAAAGGAQHRRQAGWVGLGNSLRAVTAYTIIDGGQGRRTGCTGFTPAIRWAEQDYSRRICISGLILGPSPHLAPPRPVARFISSACPPLLHMCLHHTAYAFPKHALLQGHCEHLRPHPHPTPFSGRLYLVTLPSHHTLCPYWFCYHEIFWDHPNFLCIIFMLVSLPVGRTQTHHLLRDTPPHCRTMPGPSLRHGCVGV